MSKVLGMEVAIVCRCVSGITLMDWSMAEVLLSVLKLITDQE